MASKGQALTHFPQPMHAAVTFRSVSRRRLATEKMAPLGHR